MTFYDLNRFGVFNFVSTDKFCSKILLTNDCAVYLVIYQMGGCDRECETINCNLRQNSLNICQGFSTFVNTGKQLTSSFIALTHFSTVFFLLSFFYGHFIFTLFCGCFYCCFSTTVFYGSFSCGFFSTAVLLWPFIYSRFL